MTGILRQCYHGDKMNFDEMGMTCNVYCKCQKYVQCFEIETYSEVTANLQAIHVPECVGAAISCAD